MAGRGSSDRREPTFDGGPEVHLAGDERRDAPAPKPRRKRKSARKAKPRRSFIGRAIYWSFVLALWLVIGGVGAIVWVGAHLPPIQSLEIPKRPPSIQIVDLEGRLLTTRGDSGGEVLKLKELPPYLPEAFIAIEDRRFYKHFGVDPYGIARAFAANVLHRGYSQGVCGKSARDAVRVYAEMLVEAAILD